MMRLPLLVLHILGGSVGLLSGTVAMVARKGARMHRQSGNVFTLGMLLLASSGLCMAIMKSQRGNVIGSVITFYLITTAWLAGRRRLPGVLDRAALALGAVSALAVTWGGFLTLGDPSSDKSAPAAMSFFFAAVLLLGVVGDVRMLWRGGLAGRARITRHLWRMCFGLFIATGSFFLGQQQVFPAALRGSVLLTILAVAPLAMMLYWLLRVRSRAYAARVATTLQAS